MVRINAFVVSVLSCVLLSCHGIYSDKADLDLSFKAAEVLNADTLEATRPVVVSIFQLRSPKIFDDMSLLDFETLDLSKKLGDELVTPKIEETIWAKDSKKKKIWIGPQTSHLGIVASFGKTGGVWKMTIPVSFESRMVSYVDPNDIKILLEGYTLKKQ